LIKRESKMRALLVLMFALLLAPLAQAQEVTYIGCDIGSGGLACTETPYGNGDTGPPADLASVGDLPRGSLERLFVGPGDGSCGVPSNPPVIPLTGQIRLREIDSCVVSSTNRCEIEIPQRIADSGFFLSVVILFDLGPLGLAALSANTLEDVGRAGNIGHRQLHGTCTNDGGEACALDSDCASGSGCLSTCFDDPATLCGSHQDCVDAGLSANNCVTNVFWDDLGTCTDDATRCDSDADCTAPDICEKGIDWERSENTCSCCQSTPGTTCPLFGLVEWPGLNCPEPGDPELAATQSPLWVFEGGRNTNYDQALNLVPGQQEGKCKLALENGVFRACGTIGDFWAGAANDKCVGGAATCPDPVIGDATQGALASSCDDVAFGGIAGDFCDLREPGIREDLGRNPDGTPDITRCAEAAFNPSGFAGTMCGIADVLPTGDPQAGCRIANLGIATRPDFDCNGVDDTTEGRCSPVGGAICSDPSLCPPCAVDADCASGVCIDGGDLCPFVGEINRFLDTNNDDIGDECQCGDQNGDGAVTGVDIGGMALCANGAISPLLCDATRLDTDGDNSITALDVGGVVAAVNGGIPTSDLLCVRNMDTSTP